MVNIQATWRKLFLPTQVTKSCIRAHAFVLPLAMFGLTVAALIRLELPNKMYESPSESTPILLLKTFTRQPTAFKALFAIWCALTSSALTFVFLSEATISMFKETKLSTSSRALQLFILIMTTIIIPTFLSIAFPFIVDFNSDFSVSEIAGFSTRCAAGLLVVATRCRETVAVVTLNGIILFEALVFSLIATFFPAEHKEPTTKHTFRFGTLWRLNTGDGEKATRETMNFGVRTILDLDHLKMKRMLFEQDALLESSRFTIVLSESRTGYSNQIDVLEADFTLIDQNAKWNTLQGVVFLNECITGNRRGTTFQNIPALLAISLIPAVETMPPQFLDLHTRISIPALRTERKNYHDIDAMNQQRQYLDVNPVNSINHTEFHNAAVNNAIRNRNRNRDENGNEDGDNAIVVQTPKLPFYQSDILVTDKGHIFLRVLDRDSWINVPCDCHPSGLLIPTTPDLEEFFHSMGAKVEMVVYRTLGYIA